MRASAGLRRKMGVVYATGLVALGLLVLSGAFCSAVLADDGEVAPREWQSPQSQWRFRTLPDSPRNDSGPYGRADRDEQRARERERERDREREELREVEKRQAAERREREEQELLERQELELDVLRRRQAIQREQIRAQEPDRQLRQAKLRALENKQQQESEALRSHHAEQRRMLQQEHHARELQELERRRAEGDKPEGGEAGPGPQPNADELNAELQQNERRIDELERQLQKLRQENERIRQMLGWEAGGEGNQDERQAANFFGIEDDKAKDVVYVVDRSGSMDEILRYVQRELNRSIGGLGRDQNFHVIFYSSGPGVEMPPRKLVPATEENKRAAATFVNRQFAEGATDPSDALAKAFRNNPAVIFLLTDGDFDPAVRDQIRLLNREKKVKVNTICFLYRTGEELAMKIAAQNDGQYKYIDMDWIKRMDVRRQTERDEGSEQD